MNTPRNEEKLKEIAGKICNLTHFGQALHPNDIIPDLKELVLSERIALIEEIERLRSKNELTEKWNDYGCIVNAPETPKLPPNWGKINCNGLTDGLSTVKIDFGTMEPQTVGEAAATGRVGGMLKSIFEPEKDWEKDLSKFYGSMFEDGDFQALHDFIERVIFQLKKSTDEQNHKLQEASNRAYQKCQENMKSLEYQKMKNKVKNVIEKYYFEEDWTDLIKDLQNL